MPKVLDVERPLEPGRKEPSERSKERSEAGHDDGVDLEGGVRDRGRGEPKLYVDKPKSASHKENQTNNCKGTYMGLKPTIHLDRHRGFPPKEHWVRITRHS